MSTPSNHHDSSQEENPEPPQGSAANNHLPSDTFDHIQFLSRLLQVQQTLAEQSQEVLETFCHEIKLASQRQAQLILLRKQHTRTRVPKSWHGFAVEASGRFYGKLYFAPDQAQPAELVVPFPVAQFAASFCAFLLYSLEISILSRGNFQPPTSDVCPSFTPREKEVLELLCRGYDVLAIADMLHIAKDTAGQYRGEIYTEFGVRKEREAVFAAFSAGLFSPLEDLSPQIMHQFLKHDD